MHAAVRTHVRMHTRTHTRTLNFPPGPRALQLPARQWNIKSGMNVRVSRVISDGRTCRCHTAHTLQSSVPKALIGFLEQPANRISVGLAPPLWPSGARATGGARTVSLLRCGRAGPGLPAGHGRSRSSAVAERGPGYRRGTDGLAPPLWPSGARSTGGARTVSLLRCGRAGLGLSAGHGRSRSSAVAERGPVYRRGTDGLAPPLWPSVARATGGARTVSLLRCGRAGPGLSAGHGRSRSSAVAERGPGYRRGTNGLAPPLWPSGARATGGARTVSLLRCGRAGPGLPAGHGPSRSSAVAERGPVYRRGTDGLAPPLWPSGARSTGGARTVSLLRCGRAGLGLPAGHGRSRPSWAARWLGPRAKDALELPT